MMLTQSGQGCRRTNPQASFTSSPWEMSPKMWSREPASLSDPLSPEPRPDFALDASRNQYNSLEILDWLESRFPRPDEWIFGITNIDLTIPVLTFVFGQARLDGRSAVISTTRLCEEFYGIPADRMLLMSRVEKEVVHEVGHMLGLTHCLDRNCVMYPSNNLVQTDVKSTRLCPRCSSCLPRWCRTEPSDQGH